MATADAKIISPVPQPLEPSARRTLPQFTRAAGLVVGLGVVILISLISLRIGSISISTSDAWDALFNYDSSAYNQTVVRSLRLPRTIIALGVGAGLAVAGTIMQGVTRNPLADPGILGVSSGASFAVVSAIYFFNLTTVSQYLWFAFAGALLASVLVFVVASTGRDGPTPVKLALSGVVISALLGAWTSALLLLDEQTMDIVRFWFAGSVVGRPLSTFWTVAPFLLGGAVVCVFLGHQMNVMSLGEDTARALGMRTGRTRVLSSLLVVVITGAAVSVAGPIGFVGLAIPHMVRSVVGPDYRWILPYAFLTGAAFLTLADVIGRIVLRPAELQVGIVMAMFGAPFFIFLARRQTTEV